MAYYFITPKEVLEFAFSPLDKVSLEAVRYGKIMVAQERYVLPVVGRRMYEQLNSNPYAFFLEDYLQPALAFYVRYEMIGELSLQLSDSGVGRHDSEQITRTHEATQTDNLTRNATIQQEGGGTEQVNHSGSELCVTRVEATDSTLESNSGLSENRDQTTTQTTTPGSKVNTTTTTGNSRNDEATELKSSADTDSTSSLRSWLRAASDEQCRMLAQRALGDARILMRRAVDYIEGHPELFPDYAPAEDRPYRRRYVGGLVL